MSKSTDPCWESRKFAWAMNEVLYHKARPFPNVSGIYMHQSAITVVVRIVSVLIPTFIYCVRSPVGKEGQRRSHPRH